MPIKETSKGRKGRSTHCGYNWEEQMMAFMELTETFEILKTKGNKAETRRVTEEVSSAGSGELVQFSQGDDYCSGCCVDITAVTLIQSMMPSRGCLQGLL